LLLSFFHFGKLCSNSLVIGLDFLDSGQVLNGEFKILAT
jgi:hypothetical protein